MVKRIREFEFRGRTLDSFFTSNGGSYGWVPVGAKEFDAGGPTVLAHDVLEHLAYNEDFKGELLAFGATLFGRVVGRIHRRDAKTQIKASGSDLSGFLAQQKYVVPEPHQFAKKLLLDGIAENALSAMMKEAKFQTEQTDSGCDDPTCNACRTQNDYMSLEQFEAQKDKVLAWIRLGYKMAERFYGKPERLYSLFVALGEAVGNDHDNRRPRSGEKLRVEVDTKQMTIKLVTKAGISNHIVGDQHA